MNSRTGLVLALVLGTVGLFGAMPLAFGVENVPGNICKIAAPFFPAVTYPPFDNSVVNSNPVPTQVICPLVRDFTGIPFAKVYLPAAGVLCSLVSQASVNGNVVSQFIPAGGFTTIYAPYDAVLALHCTMNPFSRINGVGVENP